MSGLDLETEKNIRDIFSSCNEIDKVILYGSRAKGNYKIGSDIDLTLFGKNLKLKTVHTIQENLEALYLPYKFDISIFEHIDNPDLKEHIERVGKTFYQRKNILPKDWEVKKLGEVCEIKPPKIEARTKLKPNDKVSFVPMENLGIDQKIFEPIQERKLSEVEGSYTYFADNDVLLAKITPCFENGKLGIAKNLCNGIGFGSSEYLVFRVKESLFNEFLYYFLSQEEFRVNGARNMSGAVGHKRVTKDFIENTQILLPPLAEQQRIVATLDKAFAAIAKAKANAEQNLKNAKELFESYLQSVFARKLSESGLTGFKDEQDKNRKIRKSSNLANPDSDNGGWEVKTLGEIATFRNGMNFTKASKGEVIKIVGVRDFQKSFWVPFESLESVTIDGKLSETDFLKEGDILAVRSNGNPELIGRTLLAGNVEGKVSHSGFTIRIRLNSKNILPIYLCHYLKTQKARKELVESGTGINIKSLNQVALSSLQISFPESLKEQQTIVKELDALSSETKKLEAIYQQKINDLDELKKSILQKAFNGELNV